MKTRFFGIFYVIIICNSAIYSQDRDSLLYVSGHYADAKISRVLTDLNHEYGIRFFYKPEWLENITIHVDMNREPLPVFLDSVFRSTGLTYVFYNAHVVIVARSEDISREFTQNYFINKRLQKDFLQNNSLSTATDHLTLGDTAQQIHAAKEGLVTGRVFDGQTGEPLGNVNVNVETANTILTTDNQGRFTILLPTGPHFISISYVGYDTKKYDLTLLGTTKWNIELFPKPIQLEEVQITGAQETSVVHSTIAGITKLSSRDIKVLPVFMGEADVIKSILTLPGVSTTGEGTEGFHVRGGNVDQNLILQDEAIIFNSSHALGFFSVFNPDLVNDVTLYKGHIPAQYGGRIASVLDVKLKDFNDDKMEINGGLSFISGKLSINAPMFNKKTTLLTGGRLTYSDWILKKTEIPDIQNSAASFYDYNAKLIQKLPGGGYLTASVYRSYDHVQFADEFGFKWENQTYGISWNQLAGKHLLSDLNYIYGILNNEYIKPTGIDSYVLSNGLSYHKIKEELSVSAFSGHDLIGGFEGILYNPTPDKIVPYLKDSHVIPEKVSRENGLELALFLNDEYTINHLFSLSAGLRYNYFLCLGPAIQYNYTPGMPYTIASVTDSVIYKTGMRTASFGRLEPRIALKYSPDDISSVKASYDRMNQFIHLISNTVAPIPVDLWQVSNQYLHPESADNYSLGYFRNLGGTRWESSIDLFYRSSRNIPLYKDFADLRLNQHLEMEVIQVRGQSYGAEFYIRKLRGNPTGWLSYTFSRSLVRSGTLYPETTINNGNWFSTYYDKPHQLNIVFDLKLTRGSNLSLNYSFSSGRPITAPTASYYEDRYIIPYYPGRNEYRIPNYSRLDVSFTVRRNVIRNHRYTDSITFSIYNLLSRSNAFSVFFRRDNDFTANAFKLSVLGKAFPSVTYNFKY